jgi:predicted SnoaL-like aldol condensation-catalyzing enzyme
MKHSITILLVILIHQASFAGLPVTPVENQQDLLISSDPLIQANKKLVYDFTRIILAGRRLERAREFLADAYIQHNPNVETGLQGFLDFFSKLGGPRPVPESIKGLVSITAEKDLVTLSFVNKLKDASGVEYSTTWFDMFRVENGKITEHWDCDIKE